MKIEIFAQNLTMKNSSAKSLFNRTTADKVMKFHKSFPNYEPTPLISLASLAKKLGVGGIYVKDESHRFGLNAFKVLGGSWATAKYIAKYLNESEDVISYAFLTSEETREKIKGITIVTATDGNHGKGIAWTAKQLKLPCKVFVPRNTTQERIENIQKEGAEVFRTDWDYDDTLRYAVRIAKEIGGTVIQDTTWGDYEEIPTWTMQGYMTMAAEALAQLKLIGISEPSHVFLQAGAGSMAGGVVGYFANVLENQPTVAVMEAADSACFYQTAKAADGKLHFIQNDMNTIMAGLAVGEPCTVAWQILKGYADVFLAVPDIISAKGMRILGNPLADDCRVISGESGALGLGVLAQAMQDNDLVWLKEKLHLDKYSQILLFSTEGDTDRKRYEEIVWDGAWSSAEKFIN